MAQEHRRGDRARRAPPARGRDHAGLPERPPHRRRRRLPRGRQRRRAARRRTTGWCRSGSRRPRPRPASATSAAARRSTGGFQVERFVEKPDLATAERFLAEGNYSWNGGIFVFKAGDLPRRAGAAPAGASPRRCATAVAQGHEDGAAFHPDAGAFAAIEPESVDYAVMENTARAAVVPVAMGWSDIGNWHALRDARAGDAAGNRTRGDGRAGRLPQRARRDRRPAHLGDRARGHRGRGRRRRSAGHDDGRRAEGRQARAARSTSSAGRGQAWAATA